MSATNALIGAAFVPGVKVTQGAAQMASGRAKYRWRNESLGPQSMVPVVTEQPSEPVSAPVLVIEVQNAMVRVMG